MTGKFSVPSLCINPPCVISVCQETMQGYGHWFKLFPPLLFFYKTPNVFQHVKFGSVFGIDARLNLQFAYSNDRLQTQVCNISNLQFHIDQQVFSISNLQFHIGH